MKEEYTNELFKEQDVNKLLPLYESAFDLKFKFNTVKNKFFANYQKIKASYATFSSSSNKIVSFYGVISQKAVFNNDSFFIGQSCDSMTHKEHTGKGLFINLAANVYKQLKDEGVEFVYGFPNKAIYNLRIKKLHWIHTENINHYKEKIKTVPLAKLVKKLPILKKVYLPYLTRILKKYKCDTLFFKNSVIGKDIGGVLHDQDYFDYKKTENKFVLKIEGIYFWIKFDGLLWVGDFEGGKSELFPRAFTILKKIARQSGCTSIVFHYQEGSENDLYLKQILKLEDTMPYGYLNLTDKNLNRKFKFCAADFDTW